MPTFSASIEPSVESQLLFAARKRRKSMIIVNDSKWHIIVGLDKPALPDDFTTTIKPNEEWSAPDGFDGAVSIAINMKKNNFEVFNTQSGLVSGLEVF